MDGERVETELVCRYVDDLADGIHQDIMVSLLA